MTGTSAEVDDYPVGPVPSGCPLHLPVLLQWAGGQAHAARVGCVSVAILFLPSASGFAVFLPITPDEVDLKMMWHD